MPTTLNLTPTETVAITRDTPEALEVEVEYGPSTKPPPAHFHPAQDEHFEVLQGTIAARVEGREQMLRAGDELDIPQGTVHQMWNPGNEPARAIWQTIPRGRTHEWFAAIDELHRGGGKPGPLDFAPLLTEYGDVFRLAAGPQPVVRGALALLAPLGRLRRRK